LRMVNYVEPAANNTFFEFLPEHLKEKYARTRLYHKIDLRAVDLQLEGLKGQLSKLRELNQVLLDEEVKLVSKGKTSAVFTIEVPVMDSKKPFAGQISEARRGLKAVYKLAILARVLNIE
jgi:hypothetical protein